MQIDVDIDLGVGKPFSVKCPQDKKNELLYTAEILKEKLAAARRTAKITDTERLALMVALNTVYDMHAFVKRVGGKLKDIENS